MPDSARLGDEGEGWHVAVTTLMNERVSIGGAVTRRGGGPVAEAIKIWKERWQGDTSRTRSLCGIGSSRATSGWRRCP